MLAINEVSFKRVVKHVRMMCVSPFDRPPEMIAYLPYYALASISVEEWKYEVCSVNAKLLHRFDS